MTRIAERLLVAGVGLIGGSLALALRRKGLVGEVVGLGRSAANLAVARRRGIIDRAEHDPLRAARGADLVVVAVPVRAIGPVVASLAPGLARGAVMTDAGSVKAPVVRDVTRALGRRAAWFCGSHPIAGTERAGAAAAEADLLAGHRCILTPRPGTTPATRRRVRALWEAAGMRVEEMTPAAHDRVFALVSHLPHAVAFALVNAVADARGADAALAYAAGGFRDGTRVAASPPEMWRDIFLMNRDAVLAALDRLGRATGRLRAAIAAGDARALTRELVRARRVRMALPPPASAPARRRRSDGGRR